MRIKSICLKNIRSYEQGEVNLPEGSVLLSGDIGSGKTTVLLALEFALFGLQRGVLSGAGLLRNGKDNGTVRVCLEIGGKEIEIERTLKRSRDSVAQDSGFLTVDNEKKELSATELKNSILQFLNYPPEFLTKTDVLYRYTVYTPQESMREILAEKSDIRVDTLRRVFGIDKYKALINNVGIFSARLRESIKNKEGQILGLESKRNSLADAEKNIAEFSSQLSEVKKEHEIALQNLRNEKEKLVLMEKEISELNKLRTEIARKKSEFETTTEQLLESIERTKILGSQIAEMKESLKGVTAETIESVESALIQQQHEINRLQDMYTKLEKKISELKAKKNEKEEHARKIMSLSICSVCGQQVTQAHKHDFVLKNEAESATIEAELRRYTAMCDETSIKLEESKKNLKAIQNKEKEIGLLKINLNRLEEKELENKGTTENKARFQSRHENLKKEISELENKIALMSEIEANYRKAKNALESVQDQERRIAIKKAKTEKDIENFESLAKNLKDEIANMERTKGNLMYLSRMKNWLQDKFIPVINTIEQEVMAKVHFDFSQLFRKWFAMLVFGLSVRLDESFTPIIEGNGYEIDYGFLSGGERTAAALAYRLALNQVINSLISRIRTKDIIILDEPTDGFSSEQLDKMRDVLRELKAKQIILVSHEAEIESFVDSIIRFSKDEGKTLVGKGV